VKAVIEIDDDLNAKQKCIAASSTPPTQVAGHARTQDDMPKHCGRSSSLERYQTINRVPIEAAPSVTPATTPKATCIKQIKVHALQLLC